MDNFGKFFFAKKGSQIFETRVEICTLIMVSVQMLGRFGWDQTGYLKVGLDFGKLEGWSRI